MYTNRNEIPYVERMRLIWAAATIAYHATPILRLA